MARRVAWLAALLAALLALALGVAILFFSGPPGPPESRPLFPLPLIPVAIWSLAPLAAPFAVRARSRGSLRAPGLIALAMGVEATSIISIGGGFLYALFVAPILLLALVTTLAIEPAAAPS
jgi:hypothetical protein